MSNTTHQWSIFEKGRLNIKACSCCGEMCLPSNAKAECLKSNILLSPIIKAGYVLRSKAVIPELSRRVA